LCVPLFTESQNHVFPSTSYHRDMASRSTFSDPWDVAEEAQECGEQASWFSSRRSWRPVLSRSTEGNAYGSLAQMEHGRKLDSTARLQQRASETYATCQKMLAYILCIIVLASLIRNLGNVDSSSAPSPSPGPLPPNARPQCTAYTYPQCEAAINSYITRGAANRCDAYEKVQAEGELVKYPYLADNTELCSEQGCCGCPGQCTKCPPMLAGCVSWQLDGVWRVDYGDASHAIYRFDAHGHCEIRIPHGSIPRTWKSYSDAYIEEGHDLDGTPRLLSISEAEEDCKRLEKCKGITWNLDSKEIVGGAELYLVYFKKIFFITHAPGSGWQSLIEETRDELKKGAAVAGPMVQVKNSTDVFTFDLHRASPRLYAPGTMEVMRIQDGGLFVERFVNGTSKLNGTGVVHKR